MEDEFLNVTGVVEYIPKLLQYFLKVVEYISQLPQQDVGVVEYIPQLFRNIGKILRVPANIVQVSAKIKSFSLKCPIAIGLVPIAFGHIFFD